MNLNKLTAVVVAITLIALLALGGAYFAYQMLSSSGTQGQNGTDVPLGTGNTGTGGTVNVPSQTSSSTAAGVPTKLLSSPDGGSVAVKDFLKDPATVKDPLNKDHYFVGPHPKEGIDDTTATDNPEYVIEYVDADQSFTISLMQEPLAQTRLDMEKFLMAKLGIGQSDICHLNYLVSVPARVNTYYAGYSLGFSFCADSIAL